METYHKIMTLFKRDMDGTLTGKKGKMIEGEWSTPDLAYLANNEWEFTEKVDGTNIRIQLTMVKDRNDEYTMFAEYGGRTNNANIPEPLLEELERLFPTRPLSRRSIHNPPHSRRYREVLRWMVDNDLEKVILFGEGYGPKIQGGGKYVQDIIEANRKLGEDGEWKQPEHKFVLFDVKIGDFWLDRANVDDVADKLGIESVPVLGYGTLNDAIRIVKGERIGLYNDDGDMEYSNLPMLSRWGAFESEGIVARPSVPLFNRRGERIITKIKTVDFK